MYLARQVDQAGSVAAIPSDSPPDPAEEGLGSKRRRSRSQARALNGAGS